MKTYPRPDFVRPGLNWQSLNGPWDFALDHPDQPRKTIKVPFAFQTEASGIHERSHHEWMWYWREATDIRSGNEKLRGHRLILRFGAVDYEATVWVNDQQVGFHRGGSVPFDLDITDAVQFSPNGHDSPSKFSISVRVRDSPTDKMQPRGKQYWKAKPEHIYYTPCSGIWQSVWLESLPSTRIAHSGDGTVLRSNDIDRGVLYASVALKDRGPTLVPQMDEHQKEFEIEVEALLDGVSVAKHRVPVPASDLALVEVPLQSSESQVSRAFRDGYPASCWRNGVALWSPEHPILYQVRLRLYAATPTADAITSAAKAASNNSSTSTITIIPDDDSNVLDEVLTLVGMRSISWHDRYFRLNGKPYFQALVLDQGYWPNTGMTAPTPAALREDIMLAKSMGFNGCRKHQKIEDPLFLHLCDTEGFICWGEMGNAFEFDPRLSRFSDEWFERVRRDINHASVFVWTPVNQGWSYPGLLREPGPGQDHLRALCYMTKALDSTRPVNDTCGWMHLETTDLVTYHDYRDLAGLTLGSSSLEQIFAVHHHDYPLFAIKPSPPPSLASPILCTEFGGLKTRTFHGSKAATDGEWGHMSVEDGDELVRALGLRFMAIVQHGLVCGLCYTQLTDIEQEVSGLLTTDRKPKVELSRIRAVLQKAIHHFYSTVVDA